MQATALLVAFIRSTREDFGPPAYITLATEEAIMVTHANVCSDLSLFSMILLNHYAILMYNQMGIGERTSFVKQTIEL